MKDKSKRLPDTRITVQYRTRTGLACELVSYREKVVVHIVHLEDLAAGEPWHVEAHKVGSPEALVQGGGDSAAAALQTMASAWKSQDQDCLFDWDAAATELKTVRAI